MYGHAWHPRGLGARLPNAGRPETCPNGPLERMGATLILDRYMNYRKPIAGRVRPPKDGNARVGEHTDKLLEELLIEKTKLAKHRPAKPPPFWTRATVALPHRKGMDRLVDYPPGDVFAAVSFPILQSDENGDVKLRRGEDWRRSAHNSTIRATDVPTHHFVGDFVDIARRWRGTTRTWWCMATICSTHTDSGPSVNPHAVPPPPFSRPPTASRYGSTSRCALEERRPSGTSIGRLGHSSSSWVATTWMTSTPCIDYPEGRRGRCEGCRMRPLNVASSFGAKIRPSRECAFIH